MTIIKKSDNNILLIDKEKKILTAQDFLDNITDAMYHYNCTAVVVHENSLGRSFFDLKSGVAGEILQKCSTYGIKIAIIGDFEKFSSKSLKAFISESNNRNTVFFKDNLETGINAISSLKHP